MNFGLSKQSDTCFVIGNGPSLRGFDLTRLSNVDTLGMNAAYRYWDQIDWYPDHYACLDDQLMETHHPEIRRLFIQGRIKTFFLHRTFFDKYPDLAGHPSFACFDQVSRHWFTLMDQQYKEAGTTNPWLPLYKEPAFSMSDTSKITTGGHSVRYAAHLGYSKIGLLGIDLRYVEQIPEAVATSDIGLRMEKTPEKNPNYFFDGYQQKGDLFNIPNPAAHNGDLHVRALALIPRDFAKAGVQCEIFNCNTKSALSDEDIFPFVSATKLLGQSDLGAVVVPTNFREVKDILQNFKMWDQWEFHPFPFTPRAIERPALVFSFNNESAKPHEAEITAAFKEHRMERFFRTLDFKYIGLEGADDIYERDYTKPVGDSGYKSGPNNQFFETMIQCSGYGRYIFLMETDCLPIRRGWLSKLCTLVTDSEDFWIMGSAYRGDSKLGTTYVRHINGNSVYAVGDESFQTFVTEFWRPQTNRLVKDVDKRLAYDCILEILFSEASIRTQEFMTMWKASAHRLRYTDYIQNISGDLDIKNASLDLVNKLRRESPGTYLLHNRPVQRMAFAAAKVEDKPMAPDDPRPTQLTDKPPRDPNLVILDMTPMGNGTATGEIKATLFANWDKKRILQVARHGKDGLALVRPRPEGGYITTLATPAAARAAIAAFGAEVIMYRPVPDVPWLHKFSMDLINDTQLPLVTWVMDDWPARMEADKAPEGAVLLPDLKTLIQRSAARLSISQAMTDAFRDRYGVSFVPMANGITPAEWPKPRAHEAGPMLVRYSGGLAGDMTLTSVLRVARSVEKLANAGMPIKFEINTQKWWFDKSGPEFKGFKHTQINSDTMPTDAYRAWLSGADVSVIAYNFDPVTLRYVQYSMANKTPECLASGAALLAIGPRDIATIGYLAQTGAALVVEQDADEAIEAALKQLQQQPDLRTKLSAAGHALASTRHNLERLRDELRWVFLNAARSARGATAVAAPVQAGGSAQVELEQLRQNFKSLSNFASDLEKRVAAGGGSVVLPQGVDLLARLAAATDAESAKLLLTTVGSGLLLNQAEVKTRLVKDAAVRDAVARALATLPEADAHRAQFVKVQQRFGG